jgi:TonB-dependent receptor
VRATSYDLSYEWYFAKAGSFTAAAFYKELYGVITNEFRTQSITNNGSTYDVTIEGPGNARQTGQVRGFELAYQQFYDFLPDPLDGLGINANYTFIESGGVAPTNLTSGSINPGVPAGSGCIGGNCLDIDYSKLPLEQLSKHNVNLALIYEKGPISARVAWNWRSAFLLTTRDVIYPFYPIFNEATGTLDASLFYSIDDNIKIGVQGVNLADEITKTTSVISDDINKRGGRSWFTNDRRISLVLRATY